MKSGTVALRISPRITVTGKVVIRRLNFYLTYPLPIIVKQSGKPGQVLAMRTYRSEDVHSELLANLGKIDIMTELFLNGELGPHTGSQIEILSILKETDIMIKQFLNGDLGPHTVSQIEILSILKETDIMIGQFLNGELGPHTVSQIEILSILKETDSSFIKLMKAIPPPQV